MAHMARIPSGPAALRRIAGRGAQLNQPSIGAIRTRGIATNAAIQEPNVEFPAGIPPVPVPQGPVVNRREAIKKAKPFSDFLTDTFHRQHDYLRISITERCNLRCLYCMPEEGIPLSPNANMLTTPEIFYLSSLFVSQGVTKIRLTGGEPTVRRDIVPLMQQIGSLRPNGLRELALTTNGISLHRKLDAMVEAGLTGVNLSLDTLDPFQFQIMTRRKGFEAVIKSIDRILEMNKLGANVKLKVNCVVMRGLNEREILPFVELGREKDIEVRFIEYMPFGGNKWSENKMISFQEMLDIIRTKYPALRPVAGHKNDTSKTYEVPGFVGKVGFITSMTNDFCGSCNRLRITSDGNLKVCLHGNAEVSLRDVLRQGNNGEPIDQEAFERIKQIEMDRHEGRLSDETILGWGQRERELLDVVGAAVKRKEEKHADLNDLANMENRPMILIDDNKPLSALDPLWPTMQRRAQDTNLRPFILSSRASIHSASMPYLQSSMSPTTVVRAFSTSYSPAEKNVYAKGHMHLDIEGGRKQPYLTAEEDEIGALSVTLRQDNAKDRGLLLGVITHGLAKAPLPPSLEEVRQKHGLAGQEYHSYWQRVAEAKLSRGSYVKRAKFAHLKAERKLQQISGRKDLRHVDLMIEAQEIADNTRREERGEQAEAAMQRASNQRLIEAEQAGALKGLLEEANVPLESDRAIKEIESKVALLQSQVERLAREKAKAKGLSPAAATEALESSKLSDVDQSNAVEVGEKKTKRAKWRERKNALQVAREQKKALSVANEQIPVEPPQVPTQAQSLLSTYNEQVESIKKQAQQLEKIRKRKEETLMKKRALLKQLQEQDKAEHEAKTIASLGPGRSGKQPASYDLGDILDEAMGISRGAGTQNRASQKQDETSEVKPVDDSTPLVRKMGAGSVSVVWRPTARGPSSEKTNDALADPIMESVGMRAHPAAKDSRPTEEQSAADEMSTIPFGSANKPDPIPPHWPLSQTLPTEPQKPKKNNKLSPSLPNKKTSDNLRLHVSPAGFIPIDEDLVVSFDTPVPELQSQVFQMQQRLKSSYPRIDTLPYDVWTSENKRTLQTWLKILVSRWQTRFDDAEKTVQMDKGMVDERVRVVLDQMVRDHDLSNEASERMAVRWHEVFDRKGTMDGDAEGVLDWDEFHADGMGFLTDEAEYEAPQQRQEEDKTIPLVAGNKRPESTTGHTTYESITRRLYSTSSRPPLDPTSAPSAVSLDAKSTITSQSQPSLPHLTASGSAHMVSVSAKAYTVRTAIAVGTVYFTNPTPLSLIRSNSLKKGDVLGVSRIAGIMAAKKCPELIPLCHPIPLTHVGVELFVFGPEDTHKDGAASNTTPQTNDFGFGGVRVEAKVQCTGPTGVEMEALTAVMGATLSIVDMCKAVDKFQRVQDVRVVLKEGGKSGTWKEEGWRSLL